MDKTVWLIMLKDGSYDGLFGNTERPVDAVHYSDVDCARSRADLLGGVAIPFSEQTFQSNGDGEPLTRI